MNPAALASLSPLTPTPLTPSPPPPSYKVRVVKLPEEKGSSAKLHTLTGTASAIRVIVESRDRISGEVYTTVGVG